MDSFRIDLAFRPVAEVEQPYWFWLTDGWYDLVIGDHHLFRAAGGDPRGVGYPVARLWEDLIEVAPAVLEEVPAALATRLAAGDRWTAWVERARDTDDADDLWELATTWQRQLNSGHLAGAPSLDLWCHADRVHIRWHSLPRQPDDPAWESPAGDATIDVDAFTDELVRFDRALIGAMPARIETAGGDRETLRREQLDRSKWLTDALSVKRTPIPPWDDVLGAIAALEDRIGPVLP